MNQIHYIQHDAIDKAKWDSCIKLAENSLIYGYSWWLDNISPHWHALILNDYDAVMPLTWRKKYGICYLYQPFCTAALGVFFKENIRFSVADFFNAIPSVYKYWDIDMNEQNVLSAAHINFYERKNQVLNLEKDYSNIREKYSRLANRKLNKAKESGLIIVKDTDPSTVIELYRKEYGHKHTNSAGDYAALANGCRIAGDKNRITAYTAHSAGGDVVAFYIVLHDDNCVYSLLGGSTAQGKDTGAFYFLTDAAIGDNCGSGKIFRFEGSDNEGISFFNRQFGATPIVYQHIQQNKLPFLLRMFKK